MVHLAEIVEDSQENKTSTLFSYKVNTIVANDLRMQGTHTSATMVMTMLSYE